MAVSESYLAFVVEQLGDVKAVVTKRMFGGIGIYSDGVFFAVIDNDTLFFKVDEALAVRYRDRGMPPFAPVPGAKPMTSYYQVPPDVLEDASTLSQWARDSLAAVVASPGNAKKKPASKKPRRGRGRPKSRSIAGALIGSLLALGGIAPQPRAASVTQTASDLRVVTYNIKHGRGMDETVNIDRTAAVLRRLEPDIVGLQEVDERATRSGGVPEAEYFGGQLGLHHAFGKFMDFQGGGYGMAILSRFPIVSVDRVELPRGNEPRIALVVHARPPDGRTFAIVNVHFDWVRDDGFRFAQAETLGHYLERLTIPFILLGDFNDGPTSRTLDVFRARATEAPKPAGGSFTFPSDSPAREIDYIFFSPRTAFVPREVRVIDERLASDHRPVLAVLRPTARQVR
jgi:endonuclease/exonuclease/phosphatase family metal-dependent hydrolase/TfoX/Sxy family transcriptional regulator of competence genes